MLGVMALRKSEGIKQPTTTTTHSKWENVGDTKRKQKTTRNLITEDLRGIEPEKGEREKTRKQETREMFFLFAEPVHAKNPNLAVYNLLTRHHLQTVFLQAFLS